MCGRYVIMTPPEALRLLFGYAEQPNFPARYNVAPTQPIPVVHLDSGARHFRLVRWGLLPPWVKDPRNFTLLINARSETALEKPAFKNAMKRRRCLVPADGYYEWQTAGKNKQPYFIYPRDRQPIGLAGLMETWIGPNGEELDTAAIVTTAASADLAALHHRMPVTIAPRDFERWLDGNAVDAEDAARLLVAPEPGAFAWHPVSTRVNRAAEGDAQLVLPISESEMGAAQAATAEPGRAGKAARAARSEPADDDGQGSLF